MVISIEGAAEAPTPDLLGDYNLDGAVDAADYVMWRKTIGATVPNGTGADGNGDGYIGDEDHLVWTQNYGLRFQSGTSGAAVNMLEESRNSGSIAESIESADNGHGITLHVSPNVEQLALPAMFYSSPAASRDDHPLPWRTAAPRIAFSAVQERDIEDLVWLATQAVRSSNGDFGSPREAFESTHLDHEIASSADDPDLVFDLVGAEEWELF